VSVLLENILRFGAVLRRAGIDATTAGLIDVAAALDHVDPGRRSDFYFTLRALLVHRQEHLAIFDEAFRVFWRKPSTGQTANDLRAMGERRRIGPPEREIPTTGGSNAPPSSALTDTVERIVPFSYSAAQVSRSKDFARFTDDELRQAERMIASLQWRPGLRRTRRWRVASQGAIDLRRVVAQYAKQGGDVAVVPRRDRLTRPRPLIVLCDISGSMERYSRMLLHFVHALAGTGTRLEAFVFATSLTRVTRHLAQRDTDVAVRRMLREIGDWCGGTRIGDALRAFNMKWGRRMTGRGPVVLLVSDGWDRGDPEVLRGEIARLGRSSRRLIWLNPLLGAPGYQPLTRGMQAALPFIDDFLPVHNLESLESLAAHLNQLPARGTRRASRLRPTAQAWRARSV
jgi:uncharacterized protein with von Willebrand factor type A (vWA) domain